MFRRPASCAMARAWAIWDGLKSIAVIRQVSESRGMNLVLHRSQVALNVNEFDISEQVAEQLNKLLPSVNVPADGVSPAVPPTPPAASLPPAPRR